ncbi:MAG: hypothetical protein R3E92_23965, partial [Burkholderiaceae bacterium]
RKTTPCDTASRVGFREPEVALGMAAFCRPSIMDRESALPAGVRHVRSCALLFIRAARRPFM